MRERDVHSDVEPVRPVEPNGWLRRTAIVTYGVMAYLAFLVVITYAVGFLADAGVPRTVDAGGPETGTAVALTVDALLLGLFAIQHSVMARPWFKERWTRLVPPSLERSTYVFASSGVLALLFWQWRPVDAVIWDVEASLARYTLWGVYGLGWFVAVFSTFLIDHFDLFGLRQVHSRARGRRHEPPDFRTPILYRLVRHPIMVGFLIVFWATPTMTGGHLFFAGLATAYIAVAVRVEERDLVRALPEYEDYMRTTPRFIPRLQDRRA